MLWLKFNQLGLIAAIYVKIEILKIFKKCIIKIPEGMNHNLLIAFPEKQSINIVKTPKILIPLHGSPIHTP